MPGSEFIHTIENNPPHLSVAIGTTDSFLQHEVATTHAPDGSVSVPAAVFLEMLRNMPDGQVYFKLPLESYDKPELSIESYQLGGDRVTIHPRIRQFCADGQFVPLTKKEFYLADYLGSHAPRIHARREIFETIWPTSSNVSDKTVDVHLSSLRRKLGKELGDSNDGLFRTIRGVGFYAARYLTKTGLEDV